MEYILLQCLSALKYLHSKNLKTCEVKLANILMPNENSIKIGVIKNNSSFYFPVIFSLFRDI